MARKLATSEAFLPHPTLLSLNEQNKLSVAVARWCEAIRVDTLVNDQGNLLLYGPKPRGKYARQDEYLRFQFSSWLDGDLPSNIPKWTVWVLGGELLSSDSLERALVLTAREINGATVRDARKLCRDFSPAGWEAVKKWASKPATITAMRKFPKPVARKPRAVHRVGPISRIQARKLAPGYTKAVERAWAKGHGYIDGFFDGLQNLRPDDLCLVVANYGELSRSEMEVGIGFKKKIVRVKIEPQFSIARVIAINERNHHMGEYTARVTDGHGSWNEDRPFPLI